MQRKATHENYVTKFIMIRRIGTYLSGWNCWNYSAVKGISLIMVRERIKVSFTLIIKIPCIALEVFLKDYCLICLMKRLRNLLIFEKLQRMDMGIRLFSVTQPYERFLTVKISWELNTPKAFTCTQSTFIITKKVKNDRFPKLYFDPDGKNMVIIRILKLKKLNRQYDKYSYLSNTRSWINYN